MRNWEQRGGKGPGWAGPGWGPGWAGPGWGGPGGGGPGWGGPGGPGRRMRRGAIRHAVLWALSQGPGHGYEVMRRLEARTGGVWRPSPGSVYPTLQMLEDEGLVRSSTEDGTRTYELTDEGREAASGPWPDWAPPEADGDQLRALREALGDTRTAIRQIVASGRAHQLEKATEVVQEARRALYRLLADG